MRSFISLSVDQHLMAPGIRFCNRRVSADIAWSDGSATGSFLKFSSLSLFAADRGSAMERLHQGLV